MFITPELKLMYKTIWQNSSIIKIIVLSKTNIFPFKSQCPITLTTDTFTLHKLKSFSDGSQITCIFSMHRLITTPSVVH